jgi:hypothetical protein
MVTNSTRKTATQRIDSKDSFGGKFGSSIVGRSGTRDPLATLLAGGITLVEIVEIASESITNLELRRRSSSILPMIREGRSFTESLEVAGWMPLLAIDMIGIGERSGGFARNVGRSRSVL